MPDPLLDRTRDRVLHAAGEVFAERGFRRATVREICRRAHVNIASVNYYFKSKEELYADVLEFSWRQALRKYPDVDGSGRTEPAEERLRRFVRTFLLRILDEGKPAWFGKLMAREIVDPTGALDRVIERAIRPLHESLGGLVREILGKGASSEEIRRHVFGILGQCLFYRHGRHVIAKMYPEVRLDAGEIERIAGHVASASLSALTRTGRRRRPA
jgi:TetR/AcrR family transcriptional regulator, regulator of cefoperazone and chloramphenicol sensitivity